LRRGRDLHKSRGIKDYNQFMGGVDMKDQNLQSYEFERKRSTNWHTELYKGLLNILLHNVFVLCGESQNIKQLNHLVFICPNNKNSYLKHLGRFWNLLVLEDC
jgi:hypothetical protein